MSTRTPTRPRPTFPPPATRTPPSAKTSTGPAERPRFFGLSLSHLIATGFAAGTATVAGSFLGVSGTVIGAALASVLTAIGNAVYGTSIRRTRDRVRAAVPVATRHPGSGAAARRAVRHEASPVPRQHRPRPAPARRMVTWRAVALGSVGVFVTLIAALTLVEAVAGRPLTDLVRGDSGSGTSLFGGSTHKQATPAVPVPTVTQTVTPSVVVTTPTTTQTAPATTTTVTPTRTVTGSSTPTGKSTPTDTGAATPTTSPSTNTSAAPLP